ncbi:MAG: hypothetical protein WAV20_15830 [Blastocatellia bacterium]
MNRAVPTRLARLRALSVALFLLIGAVSVPIALATQAADVCGMACCVKDGYCCCNPHHASVEGQVSDDKPRISEAELSTSCPEGCATSVRALKLFVRDNLRAGGQPVLFGEPSVICPQQVVFIRDLVDSASSGPRAPPSFSKI